MPKSQQHKRIRVGLMGGTFDPIHVGHLLAAQSALEACKLDKVVFVPNNVSPFKRGRRPTPFAHRLAMVKLALRGQPHFGVSDVEFRRGGVSYTFDTVKALKRAHPDWDIFFIIGMDSLLELHRWHRAKELIEMCTVVTLMRPGVEAGGVAQRLDAIVAQYPVAEFRRLMKGIVEGREMDVSSSEIRLRVAKRREIRYLVPERVERYIMGKGLYATKGKRLCR